MTSDHKRRSWDELETAMFACPPAPLLVGMGTTSSLAELRAGIAVLVRGRSLALLKVMILLYITELAFNYNLPRVVS